MNQSKEVAQIILQQLGGKQFTIMTGANSFVYGKDEDNQHWLRFNIPRNGGKVNRCKITLTVMDEYIMEFYYGKLSNGEYKMSNQQKFENLFFDQLQSVFTEVTGMYTKLF